MRLRFGRRPAPAPVPFSGRYLTRLFIMTGFCVVAIVALNVQSLRERRDRKAELENAGGSGGAIQTAIAPSPFGELGMGVIFSDDRPKQIDEISSGPLRLPDVEPGVLPPVDQQLMQHVADKTSDRSKTPYYHLIALAAAAPSDLLEKHARRDVTFKQLWDDPEKYRGELVYLKGYVRGLQSWKPTDEEYFNPAKLDTLYDGYLITQDSRPNAFILVVPRIADGMPIGTNISENISFAGYFFKLWNYQAADGTIRSAPLLIGQIVTWTPAPRYEGTAQLSTYLAGAFILLVMSVGGAIWLINRRNLRQANVAAASAEESESAAREGLAELEKLDIPDPIASLEHDKPPSETT